MRSFTDNLSRVWHFGINAYVVKVIKDLVKVDIYRLIDDNFRPLSELLMDTVRFVDLLWVLCREQAQARDVSERSFAEGLGGDALQDAAEAFTQELIDFFPDRSGRAAVRKLHQTQKELARLMAEQAAEQLSLLDPEVEAKKIFRQMIQTDQAEPKNSSGSAPVPPA